MGGYRDGTRPQCCERAPAARPRFGCRAAHARAGPRRGQPTTGVLGPRRRTTRGRVDRPVDAGTFWDWGGAPHEGSVDKGGRPREGVLRSGSPPREGRVDVGGRPREACSDQAVHHARACSDQAVHHGRGASTGAADHARACSDQAVHHARGASTWVVDHARACSDQAVHHARGASTWVVDHARACSDQAIPTRWRAPRRVQSTAARGVLRHPPVPPARGAVDGAADRGRAPRGAVRHSMACPCPGQSTTRGRDPGGRRTTRGWVASVSARRPPGRHGVPPR